MKALLLLLLLFVACRREPAEDLHRPIPRGIENTAPAFEMTPRPPVVLTPPANAREVAPGVFVAVLPLAKKPGTPIESGHEFLFIETLYDAAGEEVATSVPSTTWSVLPADLRARLTGMRSGEMRRIWTCEEGRACTVEDIQIFELPESRR